MRALRAFLLSWCFATKHGPEIEDDFHNFDALHTEHHTAMTSVILLL
ncbi:tRNA ligase subunit PheS family protein [Alishewanella longhuensis]